MAPGVKRRVRSLKILSRAADVGAFLARLLTPTVKAVTIHFEVRFLHARSREDAT